MTSNSRPDGGTRSFDCCVVGAGPIGLTCALEAAEAGLTVLLIDAGSNSSGRRDITERAEGPDIIVDPDRHAPIEHVTRRGIGGTSWLWGGRCVTFEPIDLEHRDFVPDSQWPITIDDIRPYEAAAADYLDCGKARFRTDAADWAGLGDFEMSQLERWSRQPKVAARLGRRVGEHPGITVLLKSPVIDIQFGPEGAVRSLVIDDKGEHRQVHASNYVIAMGGLETTRLLLTIQRSNPTLFDGAGGSLGRYYMGHATGSVADIVLTEPESARDMNFHRESDGTYLRRRFTLTEEAQRREEILNTSFYLDNPPFYEVDHRNATLSLVYLGLLIPPIGRRILAEGIRLRHIGTRPWRIGAHVANVLRQPWRAAVDVLDVLRHRYLSTVRKPGFVLRNESGRYALHYHAEQIPNGESRLSLLPGAGGSRLSIDYRYTDQDIDSIVRSHELLDEQLRAAGLGRIEYLANTPEGVRAGIWEQAIDGFHSIGTTRMSAKPGDGVVDAECRVHGSSNLYIASSSVFRTAGEANPTFVAACLAVRLARHLAHQASTLSAATAIPAVGFPATP
ncbi:FAD-dependent oxidoreductase [Mycetocola zhadangensis]|uniref:GMC family oxidoreductase n=1 Tax=Mycetocola zhadangensis TaxID=1164595 RepID=A0A3L7J7C7_9MICO|nr:FAD-dependent oxidoreductase [Mycetocola zhadangensis]RLQ86255.1 GMC family oxidoreductase [Mycetocola zhadangensis]GGE89646.1 GMC oxidoreductase [Mycetocola zhadangensis]